MSLRKVDTYTVEIPLRSVHLGRSHNHRLSQDLLRIYKGGITTIFVFGVKQLKIKTKKLRQTLARTDPLNKQKIVL